MRWSSETYQSNQDTNNYLFFSSPALFVLTFLILHFTTAISEPSFRFVFAYRDIAVEFLRVASPCRSNHQGNLLLSDAALRRSSRPWPCQWAVSLSLSFFLSLPLSFSVSFFLSIFLSSPFVFLRVSPFSGHLSFRLSFFPRRLLSSFSHLPTNDRMPLVCDVSTVYVLLVARRPETSHSVAPFGHSVLVAPTPDSITFSLPRRGSSSCLPSLSGFLSCAFPRSFFSPRSCPAVLSVSLSYVYLPTISIPPPLSRLSLPPPLPSTDALIRTLLF